MFLDVFYRTLPSYIPSGLTQVSYDFFVMTIPLSFSKTNLVELVKISREMGSMKSGIAFPLC